MRLVLLAFISGCVSVATEGPDEQGYRWILDGRKGTPVIKRDVDVYLNCGFVTGAQACSVIRGNECFIYLPPNPGAWMEAHELKHCAGWRHP